jgi:ribosomal protein S25
METGCRLCGGNGCLFCAAPKVVPPVQRVNVVVDERDMAEAVKMVRETRRASTSMLQRRMRWGYLKACRVMDLLEERGIVGPVRGAEPREILA